MRFVVFRFQESPKYLLYRGEDKQAVRVLHNIAKTNGRRSAVTMEVFEALIDEDESVAARNGAKAMIGTGDKQRQKPFKDKLMIELSRYKILFASVAMARLTILIWVTYMFDYWGFSIAGWSSSLNTLGTGLMYDRFTITKDSARERSCH